MKAGERNELGGGAEGIERALRDLPPVRTPPGLRERVLNSASAARKDAALTPGMRIVAAAGAFIILIVLLIDPLLGRNESARLAALLDGRSLASPGRGPASELAEVLAGDAGEAERQARLQAMARTAGPEDVKRDFVQGRKRLKGWLEDETSEDPD